jgi:hypothetical protein
MNEQNLIFVVVDDAGKFGAAANDIACRELALEDGVLKMVAEAAHGLEDFAEALFIADVVTNEVGGAHRAMVRSVLQACPDRSGVLLQLSMVQPRVAQRKSECELQSSR